jgi:hypothetical protein
MEVFMLTDKQLEELVQYMEESKKLHPAVTVSAVKRWIKMETDRSITTIGLRKEVRRIGYEIDNCNCGEAAQVRPTKKVI